MDELSDAQLKQFTSRLMPGQIATALFQALPDVIFWIKDSDGRFVYVNKAFCHDVAVMEASEIIGLKDENIFPKELAAVFQRGDEEVLRSRTPMWDKSELVSNRLGQVEWRSTSKIPLCDLGGEWVGTAGISRKMGGVGPSLVPSRHHKLAVIVEAIYEHLDKRIGVTELADAAAVSVSTLERLFKEHMNTTPRQFILQVKISAACDRLINSGLQVKEIAASLGYEEHANFTRAFTKVMGMSPRSYQRYYS
ncbi:AraC family transcriptional regulator [Verrucomicrobiaceae bacterium N1E253]|uniref:AraC family transcriptional regulator n=1 Tax=Oceaniferula marina TaxID=2748318 RepID=A0A851GNJ1_9BACT|nr:AraC family transcriptional regulator [Oceaniferula marina]NWK57401.1 AraC family transcriptional regulator [Oceaniferula marina]